MQNLVIKLLHVIRAYIPERKGISNRHFQEIITTSGKQFTTFFPGNNNNYLDMEILLQENVSDLEDSGLEDSKQ